MLAPVRQPAWARTRGQASWSRDSRQRPRRDAIRAHSASTSSGAPSKVLAVFIAGRPLVVFIPIPWRRMTPVMRLRYLVRLVCSIPYPACLRNMGHFVAQASGLVRPLAPARAQGRVSGSRYSRRLSRRCATTAQRSRCAYQISSRASLPPIGRNRQGFAALQRDLDAIAAGQQLTDHRVRQRVRCVISWALCRVTSHSIVCSWHMSFQDD
jgi:hypothetical protein